MKEEIKNTDTSVEYKYEDISRKTYARNDVGTMVDNNGILRLNGKHIQEILDYKSLRVATAK